MATSRTVTFGTTTCHIETRFHVDVGASKHPAVATAIANGQEVMEDGRPVERIAVTEDQAADAMSIYLEKRFGPRAANSN
jgi:hypothetical protein